MDCLEFRRRLGTEPDSTDGDFLRHADGCKACGDLHRAAMHFERRLAAALAATVPDDLAERAIARAMSSAATPGRRRVRAPRWLPMAAALLLAVLGSWSLWLRHDRHGLPAEAVAHVLGGERPALALTRPINDDAVRAGFAGRGLVLRGVVPAGVTYVHDCMIGVHPAVHLVMRVRDTPVTVLIVKDTGESHREVFRRDGWHGREVPVDAGTMLLLADRDAPFDAIEAVWRAAIDGTAGGSVGMP